MYERLLFPTDGSEEAAAAFEYALDVAAAHDATVRVLHVADTTQDSVTRIGGEVIDVLEEEGEGIVEAAAERARERGVDAVTDVLQGTPPETIVDYARDVEADLIVMPTHGRQRLREFLLGSVTERVVNTAEVPVLTVTPDAVADGPVYPPGDVLVPVDGSPGADRAVAEGAAVAAATGARLHVLHVVETGSLGIDVRSELSDERLEERADDLVAAAVGTAEAAGAGSVTRSVAFGRPYREIRSYVADNGVDLVAIGTHGRTDFSRYVLGGVSSKIVRTSPVPVLMVRDPGDGDGDED